MCKLQAGATANARILSPQKDHVNRMLASLQLNAGCRFNNVTVAHSNYVSAHCCGFGIVSDHDDRLVEAIVQLLVRNARESFSDDGARRHEIVAERRGAHATARCEELCLDDERVTFPPADRIAEP